MTDQRERRKLDLSATVIVLICFVQISSAYICNNEDSDHPVPDSSDYFRVWYKFLAHNGIQVKMSAGTAEALHRYYLKHTYQQNQDYMLSLFSAMRQWDKTGLEGEITKCDREDAANIIHQGFRHFHDKIIQLKTRGCGVSIYIQTYRTKSWDEENSHELIAFRNKFDDDDDCCNG